MYKRLAFFTLLTTICVGCSSSPANTVAAPTNTPEKVSFIATESMLTLQPTALTPCDNRKLAETTPTFQNNRIYQVQLDADFAVRVGFSSDSTKIFLNTSEGIYVLNASDAQLICIIPNKNASAYGMAVSQNGSLLASVDIYGNVTLMNANNGIVLHKMRIALYQFQSLNWAEFSDDGSLLVTSGYFQPVTVWDTQSGQVILDTLGDHAAISPDGKLLALRGSNYTQIIDTQNKVALTTKVDEKKEPYFLYLLFSRDGNFLYGLNVYSEIKVWDVHTGELVRTINPCSNCAGFGWEVECPRITLSADGSKLLLVDPSQIILWNTQTWEKIMSENNFNNRPLSDASISPDGKKIVVTFQYNDPICFFYVDQ